MTHPLLRALEHESYAKYKAGITDTSVGLRLNVALVFPEPSYPALAVTTKKGPRIGEGPKGAVYAHIHTYRLHDRVITGLAADLLVQAYGKVDELRLARPGPT